jgi:hypothetical protein
LYEEVLADDEQTLPTPHPKLRIARARAVSAERLRELLVWLNTAGTPTDSEVRAELAQWVPEYASRAAAAPATVRASYG